MTCGNGISDKPTHVGDTASLKRGVSHVENTDGMGSSSTRRKPVVPMHTIYNVFNVTGMTCDHCAASVTEELSELDHVTDVAVNLDTGAVTVASADELSRPRVEAALAHAGHRLAD